MVDLRFELISENLLRITRINDNFSAVLGRTNLSRSQLVPICSSLFGQTEPENAGGILN